MATQTTADARQPRYDDHEVGLNAWQTFAAIVLFLNGFFGFLYGLTAVLNSKVLAVAGRGGVVVWDFKAWGVIMMVIGIVMVSVSIGLFTGSSAARFSAIALAALNALLQFGVAPVFPLWSLLVVALDITVIYQLTANWRPA